MQDINKVMLIGRLTKDAELKVMNSGSAKLDFSVAFNTTKKDGSEYKDEGNFANLTYWGNVAKAIEPMMKKGQQIAIEGHLKQDRWEKDGQKHFELRLIPDVVQIIGGKPAQKTAAYSEEPGTTFEEDIPF